jgi:hypothetical protein
MKTALLIGCGSKFGLSFQQKLLGMGWTVNAISGTSSPGSNDQLNQLVVDWKTFTVADLERFLKKQSSIDLILFNQNSSALSDKSFTINSYPTVELWKQEKTWLQCYFVSCILPFHIVHTLQNKFSSETKVAWMLSSFVHSHSNIDHADYIGNKYQNYMMMKNFSLHHPGCFFGVNPCVLDSSNYQQDIDQFIITLNQPPELLNGRVIFFDGTTDNKFDLFVTNTGE